MVGVIAIVPRLATCSWCTSTTGIDEAESYGPTLSP
jgi:hypothetical protein